jgi:hypothetical protein
MARIDEEGTMGLLHEYLQKTWRILPHEAQVAS